MNILWITLESILPADSGGRLGVFKRLEQIAKTENIYLFYPYDDEKELEYVDELKCYCKEVHPYHRKDNKIKALLSILKYPYTVGSRNIPKLRLDIATCINMNHIDLINIDFPHMCVNLLDIDINIPIVLNEHNIEWKVYKTISASQKNIIKKIIYRIDSIRLEHYEKKIIRKIPFSMFTFVSDKDMGHMITKEKIPKEMCRLIPVGADAHNHESKDDFREKDYKKIIFVGKMSYGPNVEAVTWFSKMVLPEIEKKIPTCKFYIVGKDPDDSVYALADNNIVVTGNVQSVEPYYEMGDLVVLPLLNGGGVKVKLLEAIAHDKIVVSTSTGVEGTIYADKKSIPVTDDPYEFADICVKSLLTPSELSLGQEKAYQIFEENYTWECIGKIYLECLYQLII